MKKRRQRGRDYASGWHDGWLAAMGVVEREIARVGTLEVLARVFNVHANAAKAAKPRKRKRKP